MTKHTRLKPIKPQLTQEQRERALEVDLKWHENEPHYFDVDGSPMTLGEWAMACEYHSRHVAKTILPNGYFVSTVWMGMDHSFGFGDGPPTLFESIVFHPITRVKKIMGHSFRSRESMEETHYCTLEEAEAGHWLLVEKWRDRAPEMTEDAFEEAMKESTLTKEEWERAMEDS